MSLPFSIALSSLQANQIAIEVVGHNLANMSTQGYKASSVGFRDVMLQTTSGPNAALEVGAGVAPPYTQRSYTQGGLSPTGGFLDAAIQGNGFFVVKNSSGQSMYTRAGGFVLDKTGKLTTPTGEAVQGWTGSGLSNIVISTEGLPAVPTSQFSLKLNLNASNPMPFTAPLQMMDAAGSVVDVNVSFAPVTDGAGKPVAGKWNYSVSAEQVSTSISTGTMTFSADGTIVEPTGSISLSVPTGNGGSQALTWNLTGKDTAGQPIGLITQRAAPSQLVGVDQDGSPASEFVRAQIENGGQVMAVYSDGRQFQVGQLACATVLNPESLNAVGSTFLMPTSSSGTMAIGLPGEKGRGQIVGGTLESSTVDLANELTDLMTYQRCYQASSRIITTADELMQETLTLKR